MPRSLTASDRTSLIRLASSLPAGSAERKAILAGLKKAWPTQGVGGPGIPSKKPGLAPILKSLKVPTTKQEPFIQGAFAVAFGTDKEIEFTSESKVVWERVFVEPIKAIQEELGLPQSTPKQFDAAFLKWCNALRVMQSNHGFKWLSQRVRENTSDYSRSADTFDRW